jgi:hypothetical protein
LAEKTVQELRDLAKSLGLTKYSKLTKAQLLRLLAAAPPPAATRAAASKAAVKTPKKQKAVRGGTGGQVRSSRVPPAARTPRAAGRPAPALNVGGITAATPASGEKDDTAALAKTPPLPVRAAPMLTLRGQQPGVLHAAWSIDPARSMPLPYLRLRILTAGADNSTLIDEIPLPDLQGGRYFHLATESGDTPLRAEIGYHSSDGRFIVMHTHTDVRLPSRQAAGRGDPQWWISEADFRELYVRSGGLPEGSALVWRTSFSSR